MRRWARARNAVSAATWQLRTSSNLVARTRFSTSSRSAALLEFTNAFTESVGDDPETADFDASHRPPDAPVAPASPPDGSQKLLDGKRVAIKANFCTSVEPDGRVFRTSCASKALANFRAPYDATVVARWRSHGATVVGKTNMDEFAMGSNTVHTANGPVRNPWSFPGKEVLVAGGSSGGSAAAVAARLCFGALGSDTGGSVRQPAAYCGVAGFKPTYGRLSRHGLVAFASSLDTPGVLARTVADCRTLFAAADGLDEMDSTSCGPEDGVDEGRRVPAAEVANLEGVTVGVPEEYHVEELEPAILEAWREAAQLLESHGARVVPMSLPNTRHAIPAYYVIAPCEAMSNLARYDGVEFGERGAGAEAQDINDMMIGARGSLLGAEVQRRILLGTFCLSRSNVDSYYKQALRVRRLILSDFSAAFEGGVDFVLTPTTHRFPPTIEQALKRSNPVEEYVSDIMTAPSSLAGLPAVSVPRIARRRGDVDFPVGVQLIANHHRDYELLECARFLEDERLTSDEIRPPMVDELAPSYYS